MVSTEKQRKAVEEVLKGFGYEKVSTRPPTKRKPGPKPGLNPTEEEIRIKLGFLRLVLGDEAKELSENQLLSTLLELLNLYKEICSEGLYLTKVERARMQIIAGNSGDAVAQMFRFRALLELLELLELQELPELPELPVPWGEDDPTECELTLWLDHLEKAQSKSCNSIWADMVDEAISRIAPSMDENQLYAAIRVQLGHELEEPSKTILDVQIKKLLSYDKSNPHAAKERESLLREVENDIWIDELHDQKISTKKTLWSATAGLLNMRNILDSCRFVRVDAEIERLYAFIRCCCYRRDPRNIPPVLAELETLFLEAISRQGHSPFVPLFMEELDPGTPLTPEDGQLRAKPPLKEHVKPGEAVVRVVKAAGADGIVKADIVKYLVNKFLFSQATAYNAISTAIDQKEIQRMDDQKRFVVPSEF